MIKIIRRNDGTAEPWGWIGRQPIQASLPSPRRARKLPVVVEAREMTGSFSVETLEGASEGKAGDFLITGIKGEMYPCDRDVFLASYEFVDDKEG